MQKRNFFQATVVSAALGLGFISAMPAANATSFIPQREGEIETNLGCIVRAANCIKSNELDFKVTSLEYQVQRTVNGPVVTHKASRLFVDKTVKDNNTEDNDVVDNNWGNGIRFHYQDAGTNPTLNQYWLRPVSYDQDGKLLEGGRLEVGRFLFDFGRTVSKLSLDLFDIEDAQKTGAIKINGKTVNQFMAANGDNGLSTVIFRNVRTMEFQIGYIGHDSVFAKIRRGDGVRVAGMQAVPVPEPSAAIGFGFLATAGAFSLKKRKKA